MRYFLSHSSNFLSSFNSVDLFNVGNSNCVKNGELTNSVLCHEYQIIILIMN